MSKFTIEEHLKHLRENVPGFMRGELAKGLAEQVAAKISEDEKKGIIHEGNTRLTDAAIDKTIEAQNVFIRKMIGIILAVMDKELRREGK